MNSSAFLGGDVHSFEPDARKDNKAVSDVPPSNAMVVCFIEDIAVTDGDVSYSG